MPALREILEAANRRYLEFLSAIEDPRNGRDKLNKLSQPVHNEGRAYRGFNLFNTDDEALFSAIARGEFNISDMQNKTLRRFLPDKNSGQMSRLLKRLRVHGLIKKVGHTYKYPDSIRQGRDHHRTEAVGNSLSSPNSSSASPCNSDFLPVLRRTQMERY